MDDEFDDDFATTGQRRCVVDRYRYCVRQIGVVEQYHELLSLR